MRLINGDTRDKVDLETFLSNDLDVENKQI